MENPERIVIIDDNANDLAVTRRFLERRGYRVSAAQSGEEGLALASELAPDAIVVDYRMPVMDGFEVTRRIKTDERLHTIPVLMLTGSDQSQHIVEGLGVGADDFVTKGSDTEVLLARLRALLRVKAYQDQLRRMNQQMTRDLQIARRVQEALVPSGAFSSGTIDIRSAYIPSEALSGDFYDYFQVDGSLFLFVADVSGHGLPAAILTSLLKSYIRTEADPERSLAALMTSLNNFLFSVSLPTQYATAQLFRMDGDRTLHYSNAAHPPFLLHRRAERKTLTVEDPGNLLGAMPEMEFEERTLHVASGDTLFVYTDGVTDRTNPAKEFYAIERVSSIIEQAGDADLDALYDAIYADVTEFQATDDFKDDLAFVVTRFR